MSERLEKGLAVLRAEMDHKVKSFFSSCVRCGVCAESCLFYNETNDPRYTPIYKTEPMRKLWKNEYSFWGKLASKLGMTKPRTEADLSDWEAMLASGPEGALELARRSRPFNAHRVLRPFLEAYRVAADHLRSRADADYPDCQAERSACCFEQCVIVKVVGFC